MQIKDNKEKGNTISFSYFKNLVLDKWKTTLGILIFFLLFACYFAFFKKNIYEVKFCIKPIVTDIYDSKLPLVESSTIEVIVNNFEIKYEKIKTEINNGINIPNSDYIKYFDNLSVNPFINESGVKNESIEISLFVKDTSATQFIIKDLLNYINQNSLVKHLIIEKEKILRNKKEKLESGINEMIKLKNFIENCHTQVNVINFNVSKDIIDSQNELANINYQLENLEAVKIIADAENPLKPKGLSPIKGLLLIILLGILTSICFVILIDKLTVKED